MTPVVQRIVYCRYSLNKVQKVFSADGIAQTNRVRDLDEGKTAFTDDLNNSQVLFHSQEKLMPNSSKTEVARCYQYNTVATWIECEAELGKSLP